MGYNNGKAACAADQKLMKLAKKISRAGKEIARDEINKEFQVVHGIHGEISVISDSGFEAVMIGDVAPGNGNGFMYLFHKNTPIRNSFPSAEKIAALLRQVVLKHRLPEGEGAAAYHDWPEYGGMDRQICYYSELVCGLAGISPQELSCLLAANAESQVAR